MLRLRKPGHNKWSCCNWRSIMGDISSVLKMTRIIVIRTLIYLGKHSSREQTPCIVYFNSKSCPLEINTADFALNKEASCKLYLLQNARNLHTSTHYGHHTTESLRISFLHFIIMMFFWSFAKLKLSLSEASVCPNLHLHYAECWPLWTHPHIKIFAIKIVCHLHISSQAGKLRVGQAVGPPPRQLSILLRGRRNPSGGPQAWSTLILM